MHDPQYTHLTLRDRRLITKFRKENLPLTEIARRIGKDKSTVSRELRRNAVRTSLSEVFFSHWLQQGWPFEELCVYLVRQPPKAAQIESVWHHTTAQSTAEIRARAAARGRRSKREETRAWVARKLRSRWSPQQIAGRSKLDGPESVSHEYVYSLVHRDRRCGGGLHRLLRRFGRRKQRFGARDYPRTPIASGRTSIDERPMVVARRSRLGDYEADLIVGYRQSGYVLTVIDRKSRAVVLRRLKTKRKHEVRKQLEIALKTLQVVHTLTVDNGTEFYGHKELTENLGVRVFFTHPYCSTERASVENANGLVRYFLPKRTSFEQLNQRRLDQIAALLNNRPRKCLDYLTPNEVHFKGESLRA